MEHELIEICCAVGVKDKDRINYPKVYIKLRSGEKRSYELTNEIYELCKNKLPEYMVPEKIEYVDDFPRTDRGKVDYRALEKMSEESHT